MIQHRKSRPPAHSPQYIQRFKDEMLSKLPQRWTVAAVLDQEGMCSCTYFFEELLAKDKGFQDQYARALELRADFWAEELIEIADGFRIGPPDVVDLWYEALVRLNGDMDRDDQTRMLVYLLACCIHHGIVDMRCVLIGILPELRVRILRGAVPNDERGMLWRWLPSHDPSWDLNLRVLKLFRKVYQHGGHLEGILDALKLTDEEYAYATDQNPDNFVRELFRALTPPWLR
jgi:hypothetical protein